mgnify:CR=1 FL=1
MGAHGVVLVLMGPGYVLVGCIGNFLPKKILNFSQPEMVIFLPLIKNPVCCLTALGLLFLCLCFPHIARNALVSALPLTSSSVLRMPLNVYS